jgi:hypothetical protein
MSTGLTLRLPLASAEKLGLEASSDDTYRLSWIELAFRLTQASGQAEFANVAIVQRALYGYWLARAAAQAALSRPDWRQSAWETGLLAMGEDPQAVTLEGAGCYLESFFLALFTQPQRSRDFAARQVRPEHVSGWAYTLSCGELAGLAGSTDDRQAGQSEARVCRTVMAAALELYLCWSGQVTETAQPLELPEPDELPIPPGVIE